ncbi:MAG: V-type ATPase 116kDa subunit family protein [Bacteroidales bacterium]|nr:V-type ATPase 116kDa subunit family protein [Bacteroidales bacterium]
MKKYSFLVYHAIYRDFLENLREIGVVDVVEKQIGHVEEHSELYEKLEERKRINELSKILKSYLPEDVEPAPADTKVERDILLRSLESILEDQAELETKMQALNRELNNLSLWGDFDPQRLEELLEAGCRLDFYFCPRSSYKTEWEEQYNAIRIADNNNAIYFITLSFDGQQPEMDAEHLRWPQKSLSELKAEVTALEVRNEELNRQLKTEALNQHNTLIFQDKLLSDQFNFSKVLIGTEKAAGDKIMVLEGYVPCDREDKLKDLLNQQGIYYRAGQPQQEDKIPVLLKNNRFARLYEPITKMYSLPNYKELDLTPMMAPFFMLFFGLCLGDGGYGLLILLAATLIKPKLSKEKRFFATLGQTLGLSTVLVGILTGSFFGVALEALEWQWLKGVKHYFLTENNFGAVFGGYHPLMILALSIGAVQILFAMSIRVIKISIQLELKYALSNLAWVVLLLTSIVTFGLPALGVALAVPLTYGLYGILGLAGLIIVFYNSPGKNIFINVGSALWTSYNMASGLLGDLLSYVRLFALGLTSSILGAVFNSMAFGMTEAMPVWIRWLAVLLILLVGHGLNLALSIIGSLVHPLRLTFVEFYKNAGFEGGGKAYNPFRKSAQTN